MPATVFQQIIAIGTDQGILPKSSNYAVQWYREQARKTKVTPREIWSTPHERKNLSLRVELLGNMYYFYYEAAGKDILPYWDSFPLVIPIQLTEDGFLGINFHYLDLRRRAILLDALLDFEVSPGPSDDSPESKKGKLDPRKIAYKKISALARYKYFRPCLKRYLVTNVKSRLIQLERDEWDIAIWLPVEQFHGAKRTSVWADSKWKI